MDVLYETENISFYFYLAKCILIMKQCWILFKYLFSVCWDDHSILYSILIELCINWFFCILSQPYNLGINLTWLWCKSYFTYCWIQFVNIFLSIVIFTFTRGIGWTVSCSFFFLQCHYLVFVSRWHSLIEGAGDYALFLKKCLVKWDHVFLGFYS